MSDALQGVKCTKMRGCLARDAAPLADDRFNTIKRANQMPAAALQRLFGPLEGTCTIPIRRAAALVLFHTSTRGSLDTVRQ